MFDRFLVSCLLITTIRPWKYIKDNSKLYKNRKKELYDSWMIYTIFYLVTCIYVSMSVHIYWSVKTWKYISLLIWSGSCCVKVVTLLYSILCSVQLETSLSVSLFPQQLAVRQLERGWPHGWISLQFGGRSKWETRIATARLFPRAGGEWRPNLV